MSVYHGQKLLCGNKNNAKKIIDTIYKIKKTGTHATDILSG
jgi:hypothetical protein